MLQNKIVLTLRSFPTGDGNRRSFANTRGDFEIVDQSLRTAQSQAHSLARRVAVLHGLVDVGNARPVVFKRDPQSFAYALAQDFEFGVAAAAVNESVASQF